MANKKISELPLKAEPQTTDIVPIVDTGVTPINTKRTTVGALLALANALTPEDVGVPGGVAALDNNGLVPVEQLPNIAITTTDVVTSESEMLALSVSKGAVAVRTDLNKTFILADEPASTLSNWQELLTPTDTVTSVNGQTGVVVLGYSDVGAAAATHTHVAGDVSGLATVATSGSYSDLTNKPDQALNTTDNVTFNGVNVSHLSGEINVDGSLSFNSSALVTNDSLFTIAEGSSLVVRGTLMLYAGIGNTTTLTHNPSGVRTIDFPDADGTVVLVNGGFLSVDGSPPKVSAVKFDNYNDNSGFVLLTNAPVTGERTINLPDASGTVVLDSTAVDSPSMSSDEVAKYAGDGSLRVWNELEFYGQSGSALVAAAVGGTRTWTLPDASGTVVIVDSSTGAAALPNGDDNSGTRTRAQFALNYHLGGYTHWISTTHDDGELAGNRIQFWTSDGTQNGTFPDNGVLGLTIENGQIIAGANGLKFADDTIQTRAARLKGQYDNSVAYKSGDYVFYNNMLYVAAQDSTNQYPTDGASNSYWALQPFKPWTEYDYSQVYSSGEYVFYQNSLWLATSNNQYSSPYHGSPYWTQVFSAKFRGEYDYNAAYKYGDYVTYSGAMYVANDNHSNQYPTVGASNSYWTIKPLKAWTNYDYNTYYNTGDTVYANGYLYVAAQSHQNQYPPTYGSSAYWTLQSLKPWSDWNYSANYNYGDLAFYRNELWVATANGQSQYPYVGSSYWSPVFSAKFRGEYDYNVAYTYGDYVFYNGYLYTASQDNTNQYPDPYGVSNSYWTVKITKPWTDWNYSANYNYGDIVLYNDGSGTALYAATQNNVVNQYPTNTSYWTRILNKSPYSTYAQWQGWYYSYGIYPTDGSNGAFGTWSVVAGGTNNQAYAPYSAICGGDNNRTNASWIGQYGDYAFIGAGYSNIAYGDYNVIAGGQYNATGGYNSSILGGSSNSDNGYNNAHIIGSYITADAHDTTFVNNLKIKGVWNGSSYVGGGITYPDGTTKTTAKPFENYDYYRYYNTGDTVYYSGRLYVAAQGSQNQYPSSYGSNQYWTLQSFRPWTDYDYYTTYYYYGDYVYFQNALWMATQQHQNSYPYVGSAYWTQVLSQSPYVKSAVWNGWTYVYAIYPVDSGSASGQWSAVLSGSGNYVNGGYSAVICGGSGNADYVNWGDFGDYSFIGGGFNNRASGDYSVVCGGQSNSATGYNSSVLCGYSNNTNGYANSHIIGSYITADDYDTTYVNNLNIKGEWNGSGFTGGQITFPDGTVQKSAKPWADYDYNRAYVTGEFVQYQGVIYSASQNNQYQTPYNGSSYWSVALPVTYVKAPVWNGSSYTYAIYPVESGSAIGTWSVVSGGQSNTASGNYSTVGGGQSNTASAQFSTVSGGLQAKATHYGAQAHASGQFSNSGDAQRIALVARRETADATQSELFLNSDATERMVIPGQTTWNFDIKLSAYSTTSNIGASWNIRGAIRRDNANSTVLIGSNISENWIEAGLAGIAVSVTADDTNEALGVQVTGLNGNTIRWVAAVDLTQVSFGTP